MDEAQITAFWKHHKKVWEDSNATEMTNMGGMDIIEVIAPGRKSGEPRSVLLSSLPSDDGWIVTASNIGRDRHPNWWLNLEAAGLRGEVRAGNAEPVAVEVIELQGDERAAAWDRLTSVMESYKEYEQATSRVIPVLELRPVDAN